MLEDIGLTHAQVALEIKKPFWRLNGPGASISLTFDEAQLCRHR